MIFNVLGLALAILIGDNHASFYGAIAGIGVYLFINVASIEETLRDAEILWIKSYSQQISLGFALIGLTLFVGSFLAFRRIKKMA